MDYKSPLSKVKGLGSAKSGVSHWWLQRITAIALVPLSFPLIYFLHLILVSTYQETINWLTSPINSTCILLWIMIAAYHSTMGLQVVIEDYIVDKGAKIALIWSSHLIFSFLTIMTLLNLLRLVSLG